MELLFINHLDETHEQRTTHWAEKYSNSNKNPFESFWNQKNAKQSIIIIIYLFIYLVDTQIYAMWSLVFGLPLKYLSRCVLEQNAFRAFESTMYISGFAWVLLYTKRKFCLIRFEIKVVSNGKENPNQKKTFSIFLYFTIFFLPRHSSYWSIFV